jgi:L-ascorbate metabolism protein UlaG (beta-lactamase superfamily)
MEETTMRIEYLGHACFLLTAADGTRIVTDPYQPGAFDGALDYAPVDLDADGVTVSHGHADHSYVRGVGGDPIVINTVEGGSVGSFTVRGTQTAHDNRGGTERGENIVFVIESDGVRIGHLGDLGHALTIGQVRAIGDVDVLLTPVGGTFTIDATTAAAVADALGARIIVPMHYKTSRIGFDIAPVQEFLSLQPDRVEVLNGAMCDVVRDSLPDRPEVWLLEPSR